MADMLKFFKGLEASLPASGANGAIYITTDEGGIYLGTGTGMKRLGDFVQVANVASLPAKAHENCLYYCVAENILAKWNGTEWKQVNKQPTTEELKTLLGLGSMAYASEVSEDNLEASLKEKINAASEGNHSHSNKALLDTYTQTEVDLADAVAKKHAHTFNETELNKIVEGDVAKWNGVAADHLTSADKTTLENSIKEAKKAGTDANTALDTYKVANDARVLAVEEDIAEITNADNGILAQAKTYSDGKLSTARTEISAEIDADVKVVSDELAGVKATANAAAAKTYVDEELAKKVDAVASKSLIADTEIARLAAMSDGANKVEKSDTNGNIKIDGQEVIVYTHPEKHAVGDITGLQDAIDNKMKEHVEASNPHNITPDGIGAYDKEAVDKMFEDLATEGSTHTHSDEQKAAMNSGITAEMVGSIDGHMRTPDLHVGSNERTFWNEKVDSVTAADNSVTVTGAYSEVGPSEYEHNVTVAVKLSADIGNAIELADDGLKVIIPAAAEYTIAKDASAAEGYAATYHLTKDGVNVGAAINIPKDMVVESGSVVTDPEGQPAGTYIKLVLANAAEDELYIPADTLIEYVTSGSQTGDMVVISVSDDHKVTATITDGTITLAKLTTEVQTAIGKAHTHSFSDEDALNGITAAKVAAWDSAQANVIETVKVNGTALSVADKAVDIAIPTGALASKDEVAEADLAEALATKINGKADASAVYTKAEVEALLSWGSF